MVIDASSRSETDGSTGQAVRRKLLDDVQQMRASSFLLLALSGAPLHGLKARYSFLLQSSVKSFKIIEIKCVVLLALVQ